MVSYLWLVFVLMLAEGGVMGLLFWVGDLLLSILLWADNLWLFAQDMIMAQRMKFYVR